MIQQARTVPYGKLKKLKETLGRLQRQGIIVDVAGATDWLHNLAISKKKNGDMI